MNRHIFLILLAAMAMLAQSCGKSHDSAAIVKTADITITPTVNGGTNFKNITTISIKANTLTAPYGISYDSSLSLNYETNPSRTITFHNLPIGSYHCYAIGTDSVGNVVQGDLGYSIWKDDSNVTIKMPLLYPGRGGITPLIVKPQRYGITKNLVGGILYIKYNTNKAPVYGNYDDSIICTTANMEQVAAIPDMARGIYFIHAVAYDTSIHQQVEGSQIIQIATTDTVLVALPVLE